MAWPSQHTQTGGTKPPERQRLDGGGGGEEADSTSNTTASLIAGLGGPGGKARLFVQPHNRPTLCQRESRALLQAWLLCTAGEEQGGKPRELCAFRSSTANLNLLSPGMEAAARQPYRELRSKEGLEGEPSFDG